MITMVGDEAEDVDTATEAAMDVEEATAPAPVLTKGRSNTSKFLPTGGLQGHPKEGSNISTLAPRLGLPCQAVCLSQWPTEAKTASTAARIAP